MGVVIFLHGSGDTGAGIESWLRHYHFLSQHKEHRFVFPTATKIPYSLFGGQPSTVWFDRTSLRLDGEEQTASVQRSVKQVDEVIDELLQAGTRPDHILVGGFSQGGCLALHVALQGKHAATLGGVFAFSSFLYSTTSLGEATAARATGALPVLITHGEEDGMIPVGFGRATAKRVGELKAVSLEFYTFQGLQHEFDSRCLEKLAGFMRRVFPSGEGGGQDE